MKAVVVSCAALLLSLSAVPTPARAQDPGASVPPGVGAATALPDSARHAVRARHWRPWVEFGGGWMSGPHDLSQHYQSGQGFGGGLENRISPRWALRAALDYQMVIASGPTVSYVPYGTGVYADTATAQTTGWLATMRGETGVRVVNDVWVTAGAGGGYLHSGLDGNELLLNSYYQVLTSGAVRNGWGWLWTAAVRYDFEPAPRLPLGVDARTTTLVRGGEAIHTISIRVSYRIPEGPARPPRRGGRGRGREED